MAARRVLLDALEALRSHENAVILAGAQAIYLRTGPTSLPIAEFTTDGDLAIDPALLTEAPSLASLMEAAGFELALKQARQSLASGRRRSRSRARGLLCLSTSSSREM